MVAEPAKVVSSAALPFDIRPLLGGATLVAPAEGSFSRAALLRELADADALIATVDTTVNAELLDAAPGLRVVANYAVGYDNVDVAAATARGVPVTNTPDVLTDATADLAFALLLAAARRLVEGDRLVRGGQWGGWEPGQLLGREVAGATLGIVGLGRIGAAVARRGRGFGMSILYAGRRDAPAAAELGARRVALPELLRASDFVSLHCRLTPDTEHLIDAEALAAMKPTAVLVNTARGGCVDEAALAAALDRGEIAAAGLDVFEGEPAVHPGLRSSERTVLAPHIGSATTYARTRMAEICAAAVTRALLGERPETVINPDVLG